MNVKMHNFLKFSALLLLILVACDPEDLGTIARISTRVEYGPSLADLSDLAGTTALLADSAVRVTNGGEAEMDFGNGKRLRVFNDSQMDVHVEVAPGVSTAVSGQLTMGVATGEVAEQGDSTEWETPGGATITISGTEYFIAYNPDTNQTFVGNFGGTIAAVDGGNPRRSVPSGEVYELPTGVFYPLPPTRLDFENELRRSGTPLRVVETIVAGGQGETPGEPGSGAAAAAVLLYSPAPFGDSRVRNAVLLAVPWQEIAAELLGPDQSSLAVAPADNPSDRIAVSDFAYDPEMARQLLEESGYATGGDDVGQLSFDLYFQDEPGFAAIVDIALSYLADAGVSVGTQAIPAAEWDAFIAMQQEEGVRFWALRPVG